MIREGRVGAGQRLPPERELCARLGVSRITVRHALRLLKEQGLIDRRPGRGTTVLGGEPAKIRLVPADFARSLRREAPGVRRRLLNWETVEAPPDVAKALGLLRGERCTLAERLDEAGGEPLACDRAWIPADLSGSLDDVILLEVDFLGIWLAREGLVCASCQSSVEAVEADEESVRRLGVRRGAPMLYGVDVIQTRGGRAVARFESIYRGDRFKLISGVTREGTGGVDAVR
jgi:GntR family transcriptional regulator